MAISACHLKSYWDNTTNYKETAKQSFQRVAPTTSQVTHFLLAERAMEHIVFVWLHYIPSPIMKPNSRLPGSCLAHGITFPQICTPGVTNVERSARGHGSQAPGLSGPLVFQLRGHGSPKEYPQCAVASPGGSKASRREPPGGVKVELGERDFEKLSHGFSKVFQGSFVIITTYHYHLVI